MRVKGGLFSTYQLCLSLLFILLAQPVIADTPDTSALGGFLNARLGSSAEEVLIALKKDDVQITQDETKNGARQIRGTHKGPLTTNNMIYVIPEESKKLALIIEFYDSPDYHDHVVESLTKQLGKNLGEELAAKALEEAADKFPPGIKGLTMWAMKAGDINLMVRVMKFDTYLAVERLDARFLK
jgi:hypothetical protein